MKCKKLKKHIPETTKEWNKECYEIYYGMSKEDICKMVEKEINRDTCANNKNML